MDPEVSGKIVVVTGAAENLGLAMVKSFLDKGAETAIILDINENQGNASLKTLQTEYGPNRVAFYKCNVETDLDNAYKNILKDFHTVDILVNNAGIVNEKSIKQTINVNVTAVMEWTMKFCEHMRKDKGGKGGTIINVSSIYGYRIIPYIPFYHASKFAVLGFTKSMGHEVNFRKTGVRIVTLCPGLTYSNMSKNLSERSVWADDLLPELKVHVVDYEWQYPDDIGRGTVEIFEKAESGSVWLVEGGRPPEKLNI